MFTGSYSRQVRGLSVPDRIAPLLFYCARADTVDRNLVRQWAQEGLDWDALIEAAEYHGVAPSLYGIVNSACPDLVPENVASALRDSYRDSARRSLILTARLFALLDAFEAEGIPVVPLKGPVLAESLYPDPLLRPFSDLDLLIHKEDVPAALQLLKREGYALGAHLARLSLPALMKLNCELLFRQERMTQVDLQWDIAPADYPFRFDVEILWRSLGRTRIGEREVASLSGESLLLFLCVHGAKHLWSRLQWLGDVARLVGAQVRAQPDFAGALETATEARCDRPLLLGLLLAHDLLRAPVPEAILERARSAEVVPLLARQVALRLNRIPPVEPEGVEITRFNVRMAERTWGKIRHYAAQFKAPTEGELEWFPLPEKLFFLYYPVRAARMAWKYGTRFAGL
jgi:hypothetical protein